MSVVVPDEILTATRMTEAEMRQEIAVVLFERLHYKISIQQYT